jgi:phosphomannomutase
VVLERASIYGRMDLELHAGQKERVITHFSGDKLAHLLDWPIVRREDLDGIECYLGEIGWVMLRASGTERLLRVYSETTRQETTRPILEEVAKFVHEV